jgi:hypothetical protein
MIVEKDDPENRDKNKSLEDEPARCDDRRMPFDTRELAKIPDTREDDPPYREWWVVSG